MVQKKKMINISITLPEEMYHDLKQVADEESDYVSRLVRVMVLDFMKKRKIIKKSENNI